MTDTSGGRVWRIDCRTRDRPNVYVVDDGDVTLVDAGWPGDEATVRAGLDRIGIGPSDIDRVLLTHYDADHVGTLAGLTPDLDAPVFVGREDAPYVAGERLPPWTARNGVEAIHRLLYRRLDLPELPVRPVDDGAEIGGFRAYHTPGHTPGHLVYVHRDLGAAFLGDLVYTVGERVQPSGRFTSYDAGQVRESIGTLLDRMPDFEYLCPGHGPTLDDGYRRLAAVVRSTP